MPQRARRALEEFLSIAAHELKTPIVGLQLQVRLLLGALDEPATPLDGRRVRAMLSRIDLQSRRVMELTNSLMDASRLSRGVALRREKLDLAALVREVVRRSRADARAAGSPVRVVAGRPVPFEGDRIGLEEVCVNLLSNALKYGRAREVTIRVARRGTGARLVVRDRGIGIPEPDQGRIFKIFERAVPGAEYGGLGLGLFVVRRIVEAHGGQVSLKSRPGRGATFTVELPDP